MKSNAKHAPRVLVIDDDLMVTRLLQEHLTNEGYDVSAVHMAEEGFEEAVKSPPDLIMLDVMLPDATGFQMCGRFRAHPTTRAIPIIVMTGSARWPNQQYWGRRLGANEYILKPFNVIEVGERVKSFIGPGVASGAVAASTNGNGNGNGKNNSHADEDTPMDFLSHVLDKKLSRRDAKVEEPDRETAAAPKPVEDVVPDAAVVLSQLTQMSAPEPVQIKSSPVAAPREVLPEQAPEALPDPSELLSQLEKLMVTEKAVEVPVTREAPEPVPTPEAVPVLEPAPIQPISLSELTTGKESAPPVLEPVFTAPLSGDFGERYVNFSAEIFIMVSRLASTRAEEYIADQLMRSGTAVGAKVHQALFAASQKQFVASLTAALQQLRETAYWLTLTRKVGLLETLSKKDLETTCQELTEHLSKVLLDKTQSPRH